MIVGIDFRALAKGTWSGVEEYTYHITRSLVRLFPKVEFRLFYNAMRKPSLEWDWLSLPNVRLYSGSLPNRVIDVSGIIFGYPKIDRILGGVDVFFSPHFFWVSLERAPRVITFHDLSFVRYPEFFPFQKRLWHMRMMIKRQVHGAEHLIAVSESTRRDLIDYYGVEPERVSVIYEGVDSVAFSPLSPSHGWLREFRKRNSLPDKFFLFLGTFEPRKNILGMLKAFALARNSGTIPSDYHLVIGGHPGWLYRDIFEFVYEHRLESVIRFYPIKTEDRKFWYNAASALVFPSFFEGFGLPPLEAMACGIPVIASNRSSLPEVVADAAVLVDPFRPEEVALAMGMVVKDEAFGSRLRSRGMEIARRFFWDEAAKQTFVILEKCCRVKSTAL